MRSASSPRRRRLDRGDEGPSFEGKESSFSSKKVLKGGGEEYLPLLEGGGEGDPSMERGEGGREGEEKIFSSSILQRRRRRRRTSLSSTYLPP